MLRLAKGEGVGNVFLEPAPVPVVGPGDVLVKVSCSLISRGSELGGRYLCEKAVDPGAMGYAAAGYVEAVGADVTGFRVGDRVAALRPHAEYVLAPENDTRHTPSIVRLPDNVSLELGTFWPFGTSGWSWSIAGDIREGDTVVIVGQGIIGTVMAQIVREWNPAQVIAVDALPLRCRIARELGVDLVIDASETDPVSAVKGATKDKGARVVYEAVGGQWAARVFPQLQKMVAYGGQIVVIGLYQGEPLPVDASMLMGHRIIGANSAGTHRPACSDKSLELLSRGVIAGEKMITHRFPAPRAKDAFDLLYKSPGECLGVLLEWD